VLPPHWPLVPRVLIAWNVGAMLFLALTYSLMPRFSSKQMHDKYIEEDPTAPLILVGVIIASALSLVAIVAVLSGMKELTGVDRIWHFALSALTVVVSWTLVPTMFTLHYADMFYSAPGDDRPLAFPQTPLPLFWDFAYFSFTISAACQTSDISTNGVPMRKAVLAHTLISFFFNAAILGFAINITAGLISGG
jgi:uncharacterized membrane protein